MEQAPKATELPNPKNRTMVLAVILVVILIVVGVGVYILTRPSSPPPPTGTPVTIWDNGPCSDGTTCGFKNSTGGSTLTITVGTTVLWTNTGSLLHTVTACLSTNPGYSTTACPSGPNSNTSVNFDSGTSGLANSKNFPFTFNTAGTYNYYCYFHPYMHGTIVVR